VDVPLHTSWNFNTWAHPKLLTVARRILTVKIAIRRGRHLARNERCACRFRLQFKALTRVQAPAPKPHTGSAKGKAAASDADDDDDLTSLSDEDASKPAQHKVCPKSAVPLLHITGQQVSRRAPAKKRRRPISKREPDDSDSLTPLSDEAVPLLRPTRVKKTK
jgi:hypothetical protein